MSFACAGINEWKGNVFDYGQVRYKVEVLENKADVFCAEARFSSRAETANAFAI